MFQLSTSNLKYNNSAVCSFNIFFDALTASNAMYVPPFHGINGTRALWSYKKSAAIYLLVRIDNNDTIKSPHYWPYVMWIPQWLVDLHHK